MKKEKINLFIEASSANEGMIVENKPTFEEWFIDNKLSCENVMIFLCLMTPRLTLTTCLKNRCDSKNRNTT